MEIRRFFDKFNPLDGDQRDWDKFYQRFEDRFRGSRETIAKRLNDRYETRLREIFDSRGGDKVFLDLGCGRGEMLDLAKGLGFSTQGVDFSGEAAKRAESAKHEISQGDLLQNLRDKKSDSALVITLFHVVEHCSPKYNWQVFREAMRVVQSGGVFLVETPSLFSVWASQRQFYLDPTHTFPVHPDYLKFMAEDVGFGKIETLFFDSVDCPERARIAKAAAAKQKDEFTRLEGWLYGPMDVALWARKL